MKKTELVFLPAPAPGHLVSTVEFSKRLIARDARLTVTILVISSPFSRGAQTNPSPGIRYVTLPQVDVPQHLMKDSIEHTISVYIASHAPHVRDAVAALQTESTVHVAGLFLDMFCTPMIDVANELGLPSYVFFCSSAGFLGLLLHLPVHSQPRFDETGLDVLIPSFQNPVPTRVLPRFGFNELGYKSFMDHAKRFGETKGIIINTYAELEPYALKSLLDAYDTAPVYAVGPVLDLRSQVHMPCDAAERARIMGWLDKQPDSSVVFLCFGSGGSFSEHQIREISKGLSQSGQRFLWSVRKPPTGGLVKPTEYTETELRSVLGDEFWSLLDEGERGVVCGWAPQVEVLGHKSVGAFVSHCGWNSTLESLWFGKPMVTWPLYAEQQMNAFELVKELGIAVELTLDYRLHSSEVVEAREVERAVRRVMDENNPVRYKVKEMAEVCRATLVEGGSSFVCVDRLISGFLGEIN
uniref:Glycosyltransferase n=1 Tax=Rheum palmatum TaxID=137221 RepID=A0A7L9A2S6_RHEPA|nr:UDP-glycosyltransferase [Rheum palmatum]